MEKSDNVYVQLSDFGWSDLGTWTSLQTHLNLDESNNGIIGKNVTVYDSKDNIINMPKGKTVVIQGLEGYIVVENENTLLICQKNNEQEIKKFVSDLKKKSSK
jgi:mannose-1-phosphate guanylyltransferase